MCDEVFTVCLKLSYHIHLHSSMRIFFLEEEKSGKRGINQNALRMAEPFTQK